MTPIVVGAFNFAGPNLDRLSHRLGRLSAARDEPTNGPFVNGSLACSFDESGKRLGELCLHWRRESDKDLPEESAPPRRNLLELLVAL